MRITPILKQHKIKLGFTLFLLLLESAAGLLFPLFIGYAIDGAIQKDYSGVIQLGVLGLIALVVGVGRRVMDSRFYAKIYEEAGSKMVSKMQNDDSSKKSARLNMIREFVEFLEHSWPELINNIIGFVGVIVILASLNLTVFYGSLLVSMVILLIFWMTSNRTTTFNTSSNDEWEKQVTIVDKGDEQELLFHLKQMMKWNIKLSDLEAFNFSLSWIVLLLFLMTSIVIAVGDGITAYGALFALVMYVFQYMESVIQLPFFYQNWLRLKEIKNRLEKF